MRIAPGFTSLPAPAVPNEIALANLALDRVTMLRGAVLQANPPPAGPAASGFEMPATALPPAVAAAVVAALAAAPAEDPVQLVTRTLALIASRPDSAPGANPARPLPATLPALAAAVLEELRPMSSAAASIAAASGRERPSLSAALAASRIDLAALVQTPAGRLLVEVLEVMSGEPRAQLQLFTAGAQDGGTRTALSAIPAARTQDEVLQLLVQGRLRGGDGKLVDLSLGLSLQRQAGAAAPEAAVQSAVRAAIDQLAQTPLDLDYPGDVAALAGQRLPIQGLLDPQGIWPLQTYLLSGLLVLGRVRLPEPDEVVEDSDAAGSEDEDRDDAERHEAADAREPPRRRKARKPAAEPLQPDDGGPPIISGQRWLELELRHLQSQLRLWMGLPPLPPEPMPEAPARAPLHVIS